MGRKKKINLVSSEENPEVVETNFEEQKQPETFSEMERLMSGYTEQAQINEQKPQEFEQQETRKRGRPKGSVKTDPEPVIQGDAIITGSLFILLIDLLLPNLIAFLNNKFAKKGKKINSADLQMTEKQRQELEPLADQVSKQLMMHGNPVTVFIFSLLGIYGINFMMLKSSK